MKIKLEVPSFWKTVRIALWVMAVAAASGCAAAGFDAFCANVLRMLWIA